MNVFNCNLRIQLLKSSTVGLRVPDVSSSGDANKGLHSLVFELSKVIRWSLQGTNGLMCHALDWEVGGSNFGDYF